MTIRPYVPKSLQDQWVKRYEQHGEPTTKIAERYQVSYSTVRRALLDAGVELRPRGGGSHRAT
jgi:transposase